MTESHTAEPVDQVDPLNLVDRFAFNRSDLAAELLAGIRAGRLSPLSIRVGTPDPVVIPRHEIGPAWLPGNGDPADLAESVAGVLQAVREYAAGQVELSRLGLAHGQCGRCGAYTLDGTPPTRHGPECQEGGGEEA